MKTLELLNKFLLIPLLIIVLAVGILWACKSNADPFEGIYSGVGLGTSLHPLKNVGTSSINFSDISVGPLNESMSAKRSPSPIFKGFVGYAKRFDKFYTAIESTIEYARKRDVFNKNTKIRFAPVEIAHYNRIHQSLRDVEPALDIKLGYQIHPESILFYRLGASYNKLKGHILSQSTIKNEAIAPGEVALCEISENFRSRANSLRNGVGLIHKFKSFSIQAEYILMNYGSSKINKTNKARNNRFSTEVKQQNNFRMYHQAFTVSLVW